MAKPDSTFALVSTQKTWKLKAYTLFEENEPITIYQVESKPERSTWFSQLLTRYYMSFPFDIILRDWLG